MSVPVSFVLSVVALILSAKTRLNFILLGQPVSIPWIGLIFAALVLALVVMILCLIRALLREGRSSPYPRSRFAT